MDRNYRRKLKITQKDEIKRRGRGKIGVRRNVTTGDEKTKMTNGCK